MFCQLPKMLGNLLRELASRGQDQRGTAVGAPLEQVLEQRNAKGRGFAAAGWSARKDVAAGKGNGNSVALDGRGLYIVEVFDAATYGGIQGKLWKYGDGDTYLSVGALLIDHSKNGAYKPLYPAGLKRVALQAAYRRRPLAPHRTSGVVSPGRFVPVKAARAAAAADRKRQPSGSRSTQ